MINLRCTDVLPTICMLYLFYYSSQPPKLYSRMWEGVYLKKNSERTNSDSDQTGLWKLRGTWHGMNPDTARSNVTHTKYRKHLPQHILYMSLGPFLILSSSNQVIQDNRRINTIRRNTSFICLIHALEFVWLVMRKYVSCHDFLTSMFFFLALWGWLYIIKTLRFIKFLGVKQSLKWKEFSKNLLEAGS